MRVGRKYRRGKKGEVETIYTERRPSRIHKDDLEAELKNGLTKGDNNENEDPKSEMVPEKPLPDLEEQDEEEDFGLLYLTLLQTIYG